MIVENRSPVQTPNGPDTDSPGKTSRGLARMGVIR